VKLLTTQFGLMVDFFVPEGCDGVILCLDRGIGRKPLRVLLPHQVYLHDLRSLLNTYSDLRGITLVPYRSAEQTTLTAEELKKVLDACRNAAQEPNRPEQE
jgi:hypothetical protein